MVRSRGLWPCPGVQPSFQVFSLSSKATNKVPAVVLSGTWRVAGVVMRFLLHSNSSRVMEKKLTNSDPLRKPADKHSIYPYKAAADAALLEAYERDGFPVTILKPSTTYGPLQGMLRQIAWDFSWIDRIRQGKPIVVCDQGQALHQHMHVEDAARGFVLILGKTQCLGQIYNLVWEPPITWA